MGLKDIFVGSGIDTMKQKYVGVVVRLIFTSAGVTLAGQADDNMVKEIAGALIVIGTAAWSLWEKRQARLVTVTALSVARVSEDDVKALVDNPLIPNPALNTPTDVIPIPVRT